jgi:hypothetical protein
LGRDKNMPELTEGILEKVNLMIRSRLWNKLKRRFAK